MSKNEKITENIVRKKLEALGYYKNGNISIDEQIIQNPFIKKLLLSKNKTGKGKGKPEFLISNSENGDYLIVIECKADAQYHKSLTQDRFASHAIDGVLLYASCLSKAYNVIAIAVSGQNKKELKIDTFLHPKGAQFAAPLKDTSEKPVLVKEIVGWKDYIRYSQYDENLAAARKNDLSRFSRDLHNYLRDYGKITVAQMPLLVSGALIALMEKGFKVAYSKYEGQELAQKTFQALKDEINKAKLGVNQEKKKEAIINAFSFIAYHPELQKKDKKRNESPLAHIVRELDSEMKPFTQDHIDFDIIGNFYGEFIRYTGGDAQGLGIVLTPKHITELFADLAKLNKNSVVLDTCCGTAGFLISAMRKMIAGASESEKTRILENSLIGVEQEPSMFALAVSNMILRGDGKTNLYQGSCFDEEIFNQIKNKATVGFINPPYSQKGEDLHEWDFIIRMLDGLSKNAVGIVIVPMSVAIDIKHPLRKRLLSEHRLEAVMSMPDDLFYPIGTVTCVMVFTAHTPHDSDEHHESWFGYWKDDGFKKDKVMGRISKNNSWNDIRKNWLEMFRRKEVAGKSVWKKVSKDDEWCVESYLQTDFSEISDSDFIKTVHDFVGFEFSIQKINEIVKERIFRKNIGLRDCKWKYFSYEKIFSKNLRGRRLIADNRIKGEVLYFSASEFNNGLTDRIENPLFVEKNSIIYTTFGDAFYVDGEFTASDEISIFNDEKLNVYNGLFIATLMMKNKYKYSFGRKAFKNKWSRDKISIPIDKAGNPDWQFMENYIKSLPYSASI